MTDLYIGGAILVLAQILGIYALKTRKADLVFSVTMIALVVVAVVIGGYGAIHKVELH